MVKQTSRGKSPSKRRTTASRSKKTTRTKTKPRSTRKKTTGKRRKKSLTLKHTILILACVALVIAGVSWGILHYRGGKAPLKPSCLKSQKAITTLILSTLFQQGFSQKDVSWKKHGTKIFFTIKASKKKFKHVYARLDRELPQNFKGARLREKGPNTLVISCGRHVTHRLAFIPPPTVSYPPHKAKQAKPKQLPAPPVSPVKKAKRVKIAIVIDDIGNDLSIARDLLDLPVPITLSIFPYAPYSKEIAKEAKKKGHEVLMHLPMEPEGYPGKGKDPGPGALYVCMKPEDIIRQLNKDLDQIPEISGINNHMGSRFTCSREGMKAVMEVLRKRNKFFLDSRTSAKSIGYQVARESGIPTIRRDVFLDNSRDVKKIREQFDLLVEKAKKRGYAVGIGHPHRATYLALKRAIEDYRDKGIEFVFVSSLAR